MKNIAEEIKKIGLDEISKGELREIIISVRTYPSVSKWMKDNSISPSALFNAAAKVLMKK